MELQIGCAVAAENGEVGRLERLVFDPATERVLGLVVTNDLLPPNDILVPLARVVTADEETIRLRGSAEEIRELPMYTHSQFAEPPESWLPPADLDIPATSLLFPASPFAVGLFAPGTPTHEPPLEPEEEKPPGSIDLSGTTAVVCTDGSAGTVDRVLTEDETDRVTHLIVRRGQLITRDLLVPAELIAATDEQTIHLSITQQELDQLPEYEE